MIYQHHYTLLCTHPMLVNSRTAYCILLRHPAREIGRFHAGAVPHPHTTLRYRAE